MLIMSKLSNGRKLTLLVALALVACGKGTSEEPEIHVEPLRVPENVHLHNATENALTFQWDAVVGAESYKWRLSLDGKEAQTGIATQRNVTVGGLQPATKYGFMVSAMAKGKTFDHSDEVYATTLGTTPEPPGADVEEKCVDAPLVFICNSKTPRLGKAGFITVYEGGTVVDRIDLTDLASVTVREDGQMVPSVQISADTKLNTFMDVLPSGKRYRPVHYTPLRFDGSSLVVTLHSGALDFGKAYRAVVDADVIAGQEVCEYSFVTKPAPTGNTLKVNPDGSADFCTIQRALTFAGTISGAVTVSVAEGTYREMLFLRDKADVSIVGVSNENCIIEYANTEALEGGSGGSTSAKLTVGASIGVSGGRGLFLVENCDNLCLENLTIHNSYGEQGQAETIYFNSGSNAHRLVIENCQLISLQDTFLCKGEVYVHKSLIAGNVDFIWGYPRVCLFEDCEIQCRYHKNGGYIIQARVPNAADKGFVFLNCNITAASGVKDGSMYLARSAGQSDCFDNVTYVNCSMPSAIAPAGWYTSPAPNPSVPTANDGWKEYGTEGVSTASRNAYGKTLTADEAAAYSSKAAVLGW